MQEKERKEGRKKEGREEGRKAVPKTILRHSLNLILQLNQVS